MGRFALVVGTFIGIYGSVCADVHYSLTIENNSGKPIKVSSISNGNYSETKGVCQQKDFIESIIDSGQSLEIFVSSFTIDYTPVNKDLLRFSCLDDGAISDVVINPSSVGEGLIYVDKKDGSSLDVDMQPRQNGVGYRLVILPRP